MKTDMLSEADIGRTEHTIHQSAVSHIQGRWRVAWDLRLARLVMSEGEASTPACSGSSVTRWDLSQQDSGYFWNLTL